MRPLKPTAQYFLMDIKHVPGYKPHFEFKTWMEYSQISKKIFLVLLFKFMDEVMKVMIEVDKTIEGCGGVVNGKDHKYVHFLSWTQGIYPCNI